MLALCVIAARAGVGVALPAGEAAETWSPILALAGLQWAPEGAAVTVSATASGTWSVEAGGHRTPCPRRTRPTRARTWSGSSRAWSPPWPRRRRPSHRPRPAPKPKPRPTAPPPPPAPEPLVAVAPAATPPQRAPPRRAPEELPALDPATPTFTASPPAPSPDAHAGPPAPTRTRPTRPPLLPPPPAPDGRLRPWASVGALGGLRVGVAPLWRVTGAAGVSRGPFGLGLGGGLAGATALRQAGDARRVTASELLLAGWAAPGVGRLDLQLGAELRRFWERDRVVQGSAMPFLRAGAGVGLHLGHRLWLDPQLAYRRDLGTTEIRVDGQPVQVLPAGAVEALVSAAVR
ncbi:MAG: hypothetical protein R3F59_04815 [Myxococcota bacterium]